MTDAPPVAGEVHTVIPADALEAWGRLPADGQVVIALSRLDLDDLLLSIRQLAFAHTDLLISFQNWTHGNVDEANKWHLASREKSVDALNRSTRFIAAVMRGTKAVSNE